MRIEDKDFTLYTLNYATKLIYSATDLKGLLERAIDMFIELAEADASSIILIDTKGGDLIVKVVKSGDLTLYRYPETRLKITKGILQEVIKETKPYLSKDYEEFCDLGDGLGQNASSFVCIPLLGREEAVGVACLYAREPERFSQDTINLISTLGPPRLEQT
ncbi:MAG: GAF domain-containing protein [Nitrospirota bacterium]